MELDKAPEYRSIHTIPVCPEPEKADSFQHNCPLHPSMDYYGNRKKTRHVQWFEAREEFAKSGDPRDIERLLRHVSLNNPPEEKILRPIPKSRLPKRDNETLVRVLCSAGGAVGSGGFGAAMVSASPWSLLFILPGFIIWLIGFAIYQIGKYHAGQGS